QRTRPHRSSLRSGNLVCAWSVLLLFSSGQVLHERVELAVGQLAASEARHAHDAVADHEPNVLRCEIVALFQQSVLRAEPTAEHEGARAALTMAHAALGAKQLLLFESCAVGSLGAGG